MEDVGTHLLVETYHSSSFLPGTFFFVFFNWDR